MPPRALNTVARRGVAWALALIGLLALSACGSGSGAPQHLLDEAFHPAKRLHSGRITVSIASPAGAGAAVGVHIAGVFQALGPGRLPRFDVVAGVPRGVPARAVGATSTGDRLFVRLGGASYFAPPALLTALQQGYAQGAAAPQSNALPTLGIDPGRWLTHPARAGTATLDGVRTVHIRAGLDASRFTADLRRLQTQAAALGSMGGLGAAGSAATVTGGDADVYVGMTDHLLRALWVRTRGASPLTVVLTLAEVNRPQLIQAPAHARPAAGLLAALTGARR